MHSRSGARLFAHTLPTVITLNTDRSRPSQAHCSGVLSRQLIAANADGRRWPCRADRHKEALVVARIRMMPYPAFYDPFETGTQEDQGVIGRRLSPTTGWPALPTWPGAIAWPQPTGIGDLDDLGNQCRAGHRSCSDNFQSRARDQLHFQQRRSAASDLPPWPAVRHTSGSSTR